MRFPRLVVALLLALSFTFGSIPLDAAKGSKGSGTTKSNPKPKTVHVKEYKRKDGTTVKAHDRKAPRPKAATAAVPKTRAPKAEKRQSTVRQPSVALARDERGRIQRSETARHAFARSTGFPNGRPGWVIDHIVPLACGGADAPSNMQWQTVEAAKAKDRIERKGC